MTTMTMAGKAIRASGVALAMAGAVAAQAATAQLSGPAGPVLAGDSFVVMLRGLDFASLDGGGVSLSFAPGLLELTSVVVDPSWNFYSAPGEIDNAAGTLSDMSFNVFPTPKTGSFDIATLSFTAKAGGLAEIDLHNSDMFPFAADGNPLAVTLVGADVTISGPVPEPGAWLLMLGGLAMLAGARRVRPAAQAARA